jgi:hypothetical protein
VIINTINDEISLIISLSKLPSKVFYNKTLNKILLLSAQYDELMVVDPISQKVEKYRSEMKELFLLSGQTNKRDWPDQEVENIVSFLKVTRQKNKHNI